MKSFLEDVEHKTVIKVIAVGGGACVMMNTIIEHGIYDVEFIAIAIESHQLEQSLAPVKVRLGDIRSVNQIGEVVADADIVFIISCIDEDRDLEITKLVADSAEGVCAGVMCLVASPTHHEKLLRYSVLVLPDEQIVSCLPAGLRNHDAARTCAILVKTIIGGITDLVTKQRFVAIDCVDLRESIFRYKTIKVGIGMASGENRAVEATKMALKSQLLDTDIERVESVVASASAGRNITMEDFETVDHIVRENVLDKDFILGMYNDGGSDDQFKVIIFYCESEKYPAKNYKLSSGRFVEDN